MPVKILHVVGKMHRGGMESTIMNYYRNIDRNKVQFDFLVHYSEAGDFDGEIKSLGGNIYVMPRTVPQNYLKYKKALDGFFKDHHDYTVVHGHLDSTAFMYHKAAKKYGIKCCITHAHNNNIELSFKGLIERFTSKLAIKRTDVFFACSKEAAAYYFGKGVLKSHDVIIEKNAIPLEKFTFDKGVRDEAREVLGISGKFVVGHIGRFAQQKNHGFLLEIFTEILKLNPDSVMLLIGDGPLKAAVMAKTEELGIAQSVRFMGVRADVSELICAMDAFVLPSLFEGLGVVLIEAQATGLNCFASAHVVSAEAKATDLLRYIDLKEAPAYWARAILAGNGTEERKSMKNELQKAGFDIKAQAKEIENLYLSLSGEGK